MLSETARQIIEKGEITVKVKRAGMTQNIEFRIKRIRAGNVEFIELFSGRVIDMNEISRISNEFGLPVEASNGRAFPNGKSARDFIVS
ncbi:MAG: hypothetical protein M1331_02175 [Candidatus Marsarchaeota archaeon]|nr:hypothetical protein [Candidatus Marsarchaeota archaeon]